MSMEVQRARWPNTSVGFVSGAKASGLWVYWLPGYLLVLDVRLGMVDMEEVAA